MLTAQEVYDQEICPGGALATPNVTYWRWEPNEEQCLVDFSAVVAGDECVEGAILPAIMNVMRTTDYFIGWDYDSVDCDMAFTDETWLL